MTSPQESRTGASGFRNSPLLFGVMAALALAGLIDALYLTFEHLSGRTVRCTVTTGCAEVLGSKYATLFGAPLAAYGALAYFTVFSLALLIAFGYRRLLLPLQILLCVMLAMSLWLVYLQAFVLRAFCQYCLLSACITALLCGLLFTTRWRSRRTP